LICGGRPQPRRHYVRWGPSSPTERGTAALPLIFWITALAGSPISATAELLSSISCNIPCINSLDGTGVVICLERGANDLHMVQLMALPPYHLLLLQNPERFTFLVPAYSRCPGKKPVNTGMQNIDVKKENELRGLYITTDNTFLCSFRKRNSDIVSAFSDFF